MDLSDLRKGIHELSDEELVATLREIRTNRRSRTPTPKQARAAAGKPAKTEKPAPEVNLETMTQDSLLNLLAQLEGRLT